MRDEDFFGRSSTATLPRRPAAPPAGRLGAPVRSARPAGRAPRPSSRPVSPPARPVRPVARAPRPVRQPRPVRTPAPVSEAECRRRAKRRIGMFMAVVVAAVCAVGARLVDIQAIGPARYVAYGAQQRAGYRVLAAGRGAIMDRNGQAFAMSVPQPQLVADPTQVKGVGQTAAKVAAITGLDRDAVEQALIDGKAARTSAGKPRRYVVLAPVISATAADRIDTEPIPGITTENRFLRTDPAKAVGQSVVGRALGVDGELTATGHQGVSGIEEQYDGQLQGTPGKLYYEKDPAGRTIVGGHQRTVAAKPGTDLYLTLDQNLQYEAEQALAKQVQATGSKGAMALIMRPHTGEILAMASVDRNADGSITVSATGAAKPVTQVFEPGSVNKMITVSAAMQQGLVTPESTIEVPDQLQIYDRTFHDDEAHPDQPWTTTDIIVNSSNVGTIRIAQRLGKDEVDHYLRAFGLGRSTGLGFPGETAGLLRPLSSWSGVDIGSMPIGQGIGVTQLQMLSAYNTIANDGVYVAPKLLAATDSGHGRTDTPPSAEHRVVSASTAQMMRGMLDKVVTEGTGKLAAVPGYVVGGKTGTARIPQVDHAPDDAYLGTDGRYHYASSFVGMVDGADLSIMVTMDEPQTSIYGAQVAAPVFSQLAAMALREFQIPPPAVLSSAERSVPELSASAKDANQGDVTGGAPAAAG